MDQTYKERLQEFGVAYEDIECGDVLALIIKASNRLAALCLNEEAVNRAMVSLHSGMGLSDRRPDPEEGIPWRTLWEETSLSELLDLPLSQKLTSLNAYAYFGLSPKPDFSDCMLDDIKQVITEVRRAVGSGTANDSQLHDLTRTLLAAEARYALDEGTGVLPEALAALLRLGQKSIRNALAPSSGSGLEVQDGAVTAQSALNWLNARGDFKSSIWQKAASADAAPKQQAPLEGEILWVPFASDGTEFDPDNCRRAGKFTVGPKGNEVTYTDYREALDALARMKPAAYWRRPNTVGNWGIVTAAGFRPRTLNEMGLLSLESDQ